MSNANQNSALTSADHGNLSKLSDRRALAALQALGQVSRLSIFRLLVKHEPHGLAVGAIAQFLNTPQNTVSAHLAVLARAQLVSSARQGRSVCYRADLDGVHWLIACLLADCCDGDPAKCATVTALLRDARCAPPSPHLAVTPKL